MNKTNYEKKGQQQIQPKIQYVQKNIRYKKPPMNKSNTEKGQNKKKREWPP